MSILENLLKKNKIPVFGTHEFYYDTSEFDRVRDDGVSVIDLLPETRVFIGGSEVTKDVISVNVTHKVNGNTCEINLTNPQGRYEIQRQDLMKKWREDKDILATYDYKYFDKEKGGIDLFKFLQSEDLENIATNAITGAARNSTIGAVGGVVTSKLIQKGVDLLTGVVPNKGTTRMLFEVKHTSGISKKAGDLVFDYRDPIYIFMKGRFSPMWYFAFSGLVTTWSENDAYGSDNSLSLRGEDIFYLLKKSKVQERGALYFAGNFENAIVNPSQKAATELYSDKENYPLRDMVKRIMFGDDYFRYVENNHISTILGNIDPTTKGVDTSYYESQVNTQGSVFNQMRSSFGFKNTFNFTESNVKMSKTHVSDMQQRAHGPNSMPLSHWQQVYFQLNELNLDQYVNLKSYLNDSLRFWETKHKISTSNPDNNYTGWSDNEAFGISGNHPALKASFIDNFDMLKYVWNEIKHSTSGDDSKLDGVIISPYEKIIESVAGSPTEISRGPGQLGSNANLFRPRLFLTLPKKYQSDHPLKASAFGAFELTQAKGRTIFEVLTSGVTNIDFVTYVSPMGDLFIEPNWYDTHPLEHMDYPSGQVLRNTKVEKTKIRIPDINSESDIPVSLNFNAYDYRTTNDHPFFIMEKDRSRFSQSFSPENIKTKVTVRGSVSKSGAAVIESAFSTEELNQLTLFSMDQQSDSSINTGIYVADGFKAKFKRLYKSFAAILKTKVDMLKQKYMDAKLQVFFSDNTLMMEMTVGDVIQSFQDMLIETNITEDSHKDINILKKYKLDDTDITRIIAPLSIDTTYNLFISSTTPTENPQYIFAGKDTGLTVSTELLFRTAMPKLYGLYIQTLSDKEAVKDKTKPKVETTSLSSITLGTTINTLLGITHTPSSSTVVGNLYDLYKNTGNAVKDSGVVDELANVNSCCLLITNATIGAITLSGSSDSALTDPITKAYNDYYQINDSANLPIKSVKTMGDIKFLQKLGLYNPRLDMVRRYGYNPNASEITNFYVSNGKEALYYATSMFQKLFSETTTFDIECLARPEFQLNRTYYCQRKDAIGLMTEFNLGWAYGSEALSNIKLTNIRKNVATYAYSLGASLDEFDNNSPKNNKYFMNQADKYFLYQKMASIMIKAATGAAGTVATGLAAKSQPKIAGVIGDEVAGVTNYALSKIEVGGLYSIHDFIGHIDYNQSAYTSTENPEMTVVKNMANDAAILGQLYTKFFPGTDSQAGANYIIIVQYMQAIDKIQLSIKNAAIKIVDYNNEIIKQQSIIDGTLIGDVVISNPKDRLFQLYTTSKNAATSITKLNAQVSQTSKQILSYFTILYGAQTSAFYDANFFIPIKSIITYDDAGLMLSTLSDDLNDLGSGSLYAQVRPYIESAGSPNYNLITYYDAAVTKEFEGNPPINKYYFEDTTIPQGAPGSNQ